MTISNEIKKDMIFYNYKKEDDIFSFINKDIILPLFISSLDKDNISKSITINIENILEGMSYILYYKNISDYKSIVKRILEENESTLFGLIEKERKNKNYEKIYKILRAIEKRKLYDEEKINKLIAQTELEILDIKEELKDEKLIKDCEKRIVKVLDKNENNTLYIMFLGDLYYKTKMFTKAELMYKKAQISSVDYREELTERLKLVEREARDEKINYFISTNQLEEAAKLLEINDDFESYIKITEIQLVTHGIEKAKATLERLLTEKPINENEREILKNILEKFQEMGGNVEN